MTNSDQRRTIALVVLAVMLAAGVVTVVWTNCYGGAVIIHESGQKSWQRHYSRASAVGAVVESLDGGFAIVGTSASGMVEIIRTDASGMIEWQQTYGQGTGNSLVQTSDGGFVVAATKAADDGNMSWLLKTDADGNLLWNREFDGYGFVGVVNASDGGYVLLGSVSSGAVEYAQLVKINADGSPQWAWNYSSSQASVNKLYTLITTADGGYAASGEIQYSNNGVTVSNGWFLKTDSNGELQVNRPFAMNGQTVLYSVAQSSDGGYLLVGSTANSTSSPHSAVLIKTDGDGHSLWSQINQTVNSFNATSFNLYSIGKAVKGNYYYLTGYLGDVGIVVEKIREDGQALDIAMFGFTSAMFTEPTDSHVIGISVEAGGYAWVGYSEGSIWLTETYYYITS